MLTSHCTRSFRACAKALYTLVSQRADAKALIFHGRVRHLQSSGMEPACISLVNVLHLPIHAIKSSHFLVIVCFSTSLGEAVMALVGVTLKCLYAPWRGKPFGFPHVHWFCSQGAWSGARWQPSQRGSWLENGDVLVRLHVDLVKNFCQVSNVVCFLLHQVLFSDVVSQCFSSMNMCPRARFAQSVLECSHLVI